MSDGTALAKTANKSPLREVVNWIIQGHDQQDILEAIATQWPGTKPKPLIIQAIKQIEEAGEPDPRLIKGFAVEATREVYRKCMEVGDHQTALRALKQLVELAK
jgi:hypothetical protein